MIRYFWPGVWCAFWRTDTKNIYTERLAKHEAWQALIEELAESVKP
jgi:hypothetical protein